MEIPKPDEVQGEVDAWLATHPDYAKHVDWVRYMPQGSERPKDATHVLRLAAIVDGESSDHEANIAIKFKFLAKHFVNGLLKEY